MEFGFDEELFAGMDAGASARDTFPEILTYEDARSRLWNSPNSEFLFGVEGKGESVNVDLSSDTPHVLVAAGSGAGKSVIARSIATQALVKGGTVVFLDYKRISHRWAKNLPQVHYAPDVVSIARGLVSLAAEVHRRMEIIDNSPLSIEAALADEVRIVVIAEEMNQMMEALKDFETGLPKDHFKPTRGFADIMNLGRAAKVHVVGFAQYPDYTVVPKRLMESFGYRVLLKHSYNMWNLLVSRSAGANPSRSNHPGRGYVVAGDQVTKTQFLYFEEEECAELVRVAYEARERMGLVPNVSKRDDRRRARDAQRALTRAHS